MHTVLPGHDTSAAEGWEDFLRAIAADPRIKASARPCIAKWVARWLREQGPESEEATRSFFEKLGRGIVYAHDGKGGKHRTLTLPRKIERRVRERLQAGEAIHRSRLEAGTGEAHLRAAYRRKHPGKAFEWAGQWATMIYLHVMKRPGAGAPSPLDYDGND